MPPISDMELGTIQLGSSGELTFNGRGTYYHDHNTSNTNCAKNLSPFVFTQAFYQNNAPEWPDNFSASIQQTSPCNFRVKKQRTDAPHAGWGQQLRAMYGMIWVKDQDANNPTVSAS